MASVLVIDEYAPFLEVMEFCLAKYGHTAVLAGSLGAGLELAAKQRVDLALLDMGVPWTNGLAACAEFKRASGVGGAPVVLMTSAVNADVRSRAKAAGAAEVIAKPFQWPELLAVLARHIATAK